MPPPERRPAAGSRFAGCRSILFVPADRPDRCAKALASGADAVCIDLEDAVPRARKAAGRAALRALLAGRVQAVAGQRAGEAPGASEPVGAQRPDAPDQRRPLLVVRINDPDSPDGRLDAEMLSDGRLDGRLDAAMIPKVRARLGLRRAAQMLPDGLPLLPMIETAAGLASATEIGGGATADGDSSRGSVAGLVFGGFDLVLELGAEPGWEPLLYARSRVVHAASLAGVPAFDMPSPVVHGDLAGVQDEADRARRLGFSGKVVIHPAQLSAVHRAFTPSDDAVAAARRVVAADREAAGGPLVLDGRMVDRPIVAAARKTLAKSRASAMGRCSAS